MKIKLERPICFFDLETTGLDIVNDRIVEIAILKLLPNGNKESKTWLVNPEMPIPKEVSDIHGIHDKDVAEASTFQELSKEISLFIQNCDLVGYNSNRFDLPLLAEEMLRAEVDFNPKNIKAVDVQTIFHKMEKRTLEAAYQFYCDKTLVNAHSAAADTLATYEVLMGQLDKYDDLEPTVSYLSEFSTQKKNADFAGYIAYNKDEQEIFSFGKYKGQLVEDILEKDKGYFGWIVKSDFPRYTKKILTAIKLRKLNTK